MKTYLTKEQIQERLKALPRNPNIPIRDEIRQRVQKLAKINLPKKPKYAVWS